jgi:hypothetical protein
MNLFEMKRFFSDLNLTGPDLLLRDYGRRAFPILEAALLTVPFGQALTLDFTGVSLMDTSFADETVVELAVRLRAGDYGDRFLVLRQPSAATIDNLEGTVARRASKVTILISTANGMHFIGHVQPNLVEAWNMVVREGSLTARSLADQLELAINTASMRLIKLYKSRLLSRYEEITQGGRQHIYQIPA